MNKTLGKSLYLSPRGDRERPKIAPRPLQDRPRTAQERPKTAQERLKTAQERPKTAPRRPKSDPRATRERPRATQDRPRATQELRQRPNSDPQKFFIKVSKKPPIPIEFPFIRISDVRPTYGLSAVQRSGRKTTPQKYSAARRSPAHAVE